MYAELLGLAVFFSVSLNAEPMEFLVSVNPNALKTCDVITQEVQAMRSTTTKCGSRLTKVEDLVAQWLDSLDAIKRRIAPQMLRML